MRNCNCSGSGSIRIIGGDGVIITGFGTLSDPYVISESTTSYAGTLIGVNTETVSTLITGSGTNLDPFRVTSTSALAVADLSDVVDASGPNIGETLIWNGASWEFSTPSTTPPGAVGTTAGIAGDGSAGNEIRINVSDTSTTSTTGLATYIDSAGKLRAVQPSFSGAWSTITGIPDAFPSSWGIVSGKPTSFTPSSHPHSGTDITTGTVPAARLPRLNGISGLTISDNAPSGGVDGDVWLEW